MRVCVLSVDEECENAHIPISKGRKQMIIAVAHTDTPLVTIIDPTADLEMDSYFYVVYPQPDNTAEYAALMAEITDPQM